MISILVFFDYYVSVLLKKYFYSLLFLFLFFLSASQANAATYFVSNSGNDNNTGSQSSPFKTFQKAISVLSPGDELKIFAGTYNQRIFINTSGNSNNWITISPVSGKPIINGNHNIEPLEVKGDYIKISGLEITKEENYCADVDISSQNVIFDNVNIHECNWTWN